MGTIHTLCQNPELAARACNLTEGGTAVADNNEEFTFTPDYNYFRFFDLEEHKGRGEGSATTSFSQPQFSTVRSVELRQHTESVRTVSWNTTGQYFATGSVDRTVAVWEIDNMELRAHTGSIDQLCWDPKTPNRLATASSDKTVRVWNAQTGELLHLISTPGENINICWSPDGKYLAVGNKTMTISFIDVENCYCLDIDPYGRFLATGGADGKVSIWCLKTLACLVTYNKLRLTSLNCDPQTGHTIHQVECTKPVNSIAWHPNRHLLGFSADVIRSEDEIFRSTNLPLNQVKVFGI
ncbi:hypothetical protein L0F63_003725 [Massospora cicadina]|nr:hypothetical protein L0F63_003725 [Massospora cicadina]